jgi:HEAT repeat protein
VSDVVPALIAVLERDPNRKVRHDAVRVLLRLSSRDARAGEAIQKATDDDDHLVRAVATAAVDGRQRDIRSRKVLRRRARSEATRSRQEE